MHQHRLPGLESSLSEQRIMCRDEDLRHSSRLGPTDVLRNGCQVTSRHNDEFSLRPASADAKHTLTWLQGAYFGSYLINLAGKLEARDVFWRASWRRIVALPLQNICSIECGSVHTNAYAIGCLRFRSFNLPNLQRLNSTGPGNPNSFHGRFTPQTI